MGDEGAAALNTLRALVIAMAVACGSAESPPAGSPPASSPDAAVPSIDAAGIDIDRVVAQQWSDGCFMVRDAGGALHVSDRARCDQPRRPYSTFKIANALIAVDAGVLAGPDAAMAWDRRAIPDSKRFREAWRKPHTLRTAMAVSALPHFRTLARTLGEARMRAGLATLDYGNRSIAGGLDQFWLRGELRISAARQLALVEDLARDRLAVSAHAQRSVRAVLELARAPDAVLRGKTGTGPIEGGKGGWLAWQVGWIERGRAIVPYACWMEVAGDDVDAVRGAREQRLRATLDALGLFPAVTPG